MRGRGVVEVLADDVANQIAAGEVVDRPASVIKELVENALDAEATRIILDVEDAGRTLIRILDDGFGMSREDASRAILRHATSKLRRAEDLHAIATLGFRGEALPSIASVSRFTLVSQREEDEVGVRVEIEGGGPARIAEAGAPVGTRIEVRDLFFNVPARLKFLKRDVTETGQIQQLLHAFALGYPHIHFRLNLGERTSLDYPAVKHLRERAAQVLGREPARHIHEVSADSHGIGIVGFVGSPQKARSNAQQVYLFVNGRRIRDKGLYHALVSAYGPDLPAGRFPQAVLYLHLSPKDVDVNVHPAKSEVRFAHAQVVYQVLSEAVRATVRGKPWRAADGLPLEQRMGLGVAEPPAPYRPSLDLYRAPPPLRPVTAPLPLATPPAPLDGPMGSAPPLPSAARTPGEATSSAPQSARAESPTEVAPPSSPAVDTARPALVGRLSTGHLLIETPGPRLGLILPLSLHRALTRAELLCRAEREAIPTRPLVMPIMATLSPRCLKALTPRLPDLGHLGLWVESFGGNSVQLLGLPTPLQGTPGRALVEAVAEHLARHPRCPARDLVETMAAAASPPETALEPQSLMARWWALPPTTSLVDSLTELPLPPLPELDAP